MKKIFALLLAGIMTTTLSLNSFAAPITPDLEVGAVMINQETGEKIPVEVEYSVTPAVQLFSIGGETSYVVEATADFTLPSSGIQPLYTDTSTTENGVVATISINYDRSGDDIRVNKVDGSWTPSSDWVYLNNREVHYGDGVPFGGHSDHKYPTTNSFSYTTGWGWVQWYPASATAMSGARAFSSAIVGISGMAHYTVEVFVTASK